MDSTAYLFPSDGAWLLKIGGLGIYVDTKDEGIELCQRLAAEYGIDTLRVADVNNGFPDGLS